MCFASETDIIEENAELYKVRYAVSIFSVQNTSEFMFFNVLFSEHIRITPGIPNVTELRK